MQNLSKKARKTLLDLSFEPDGVLKASTSPSSDVRELIEAGAIASRGSILCGPKSGKSGALWALTDHGKSMAADIIWDSSNALHPTAVEAQIHWAWLIEHLDFAEISESQ